MNLQAIVDENKQVIFDDNGNIFVYNSLNNCATYMEDTAENRNLLNMPLQNDEMIGQGSNANCSADKTKDDGPRWTHNKILLLFSLYQDNINLFKSAKKTNRSIWNGIAECMAKKGYMFTGIQCDIKFRNLKKTYKRIIDNNKGTGNGAISWPYFDLFDSLFGKSADTVPIATASNTDGYLSRCSTPGTPDTSVDSGELIEKPSTSDRSIQKRRRLPPDEEPHWIVFATLINFQDYHVVFLYHPESDRCLIYDLDSELPFPTYVHKYVTETFRTDQILKSDYFRFFRIIPAVDFLQDFASDRRHMKRSDGTWIKPPPNYPAIASAVSTHNLEDYIQMDEKKGPGQVLNLSQFVKCFYKPTT
ncbi:hypothetical protein FQA39_LY18363 [Lamprigera yunnana]|nr:hypothetical protein FQA39_LY18363 [Lamprigera yunnana]